MEYGSNMYGICVEYVCNMYGMCMELAYPVLFFTRLGPTLMPMVCRLCVVSAPKKRGMEYVWNMYGICMEYVWNMDGIYIWKMYGIYIYMAYSRLLVDPGHAPKKLPVGTTEVQLYNQGDGT